MKFCCDQQQLIFIPPVLVALLALLTPQTASAPLLRHDLVLP